MTALSLPARRAQRKAVRVRVLMAAPLVVLLLGLLVYPVGQLLLLSVYHDGSFSLAPYRQLFASSVYIDVLLIDRKSTRLNSSHLARSRMPSSA